MFRKTEDPQPMYHSVATSAGQVIRMAFVIGLAVGLAAMGLGGLGAGFTIRAPEPVLWMLRILGMIVLVVAVTMAAFWVLASLATWKGTWTWAPKPKPEGPHVAHVNRWMRIDGTPEVVDQHSVQLPLDVGDFADVVEFMRQNGTSRRAVAGYKTRKGTHISQSLWAKVRDSLVDMGALYDAGSGYEVSADIDAIMREIMQ